MKNRVTLLCLCVKVIFAPITRAPIKIKPMRKLIITTLELAAIATLCGCSSIIEGRSQELVINTNPPGATCTLERNGMPVGSVASTPSAILIEKTKYDLVVKCDKDGYQEATFFNKSDAAGATVGNIILGGGIGWAIDSATGSDNKYDSPMNITLVPKENTVASHEDQKEKPQIQTNAAASTGAVAPLLAQMPENTEKQTTAVDFPTGKNGSQ